MCFAPAAGEQFWHGLKKHVYMVRSWDHYWAKSSYKGTFVYLQICWQKVKKNPQHQVSSHKICLCVAVLQKRTLKPKQDFIFCLVVECKTHTAKHNNPPLTHQCGMGAQIQLQVGQKDYVRRWIHHPKPHTCPCLGPELQTNMNDEATKCNILTCSYASAWW